MIHNALGGVGQVIAVHPDAKSPAASKHVEFVLASSQTVEQIAAKGRIPTISEEVTIELMLEPSPVPEAGLVTAALRSSKKDSLLTSRGERGQKFPQPRELQR